MVAELRTDDKRRLLVVLVEALPVRLPIALREHDRRLAAPILLEDALLRRLLLLDQHHLAVGEIQVLAVVQWHGDALREGRRLHLPVALVVAADQLAEVDGQAGR